MQLGPFHFLSDLILFSVFIVTLSCKWAGSSAQMKSVHIAQTSPKNQGNSGICWAYATVGMLEAEIIKREHEPIILSEAYVAFYKMFLSLQSMLDPALEISVEDIRLGSDAGGSLVAVTIIEQFGIVPKSIIPPTADFDQRYSSTDIDAWIKKNIQDEKSKKYFFEHPEDLLKGMEEALKIEMPRYDKLFTYGGQTYTPMSFAKERLQFSKNDYKLMTISRDNSSKIFEHIMNSLLQGHTVPLGISFDFPAGSGQDHNNPFTLSHCSVERPCHPDSGNAHELLLVDFSTKGGRFGPMNYSEITKVAKEPLEALIAKNSYGSKWGVSQEGENDSSSEDRGYNFVTAEFLAPPPEKIGNQQFDGPNVLLRKSIIKESGNDE